MKLLAIDGNSIMNRAYYGVRPLRNSRGVYTHAILGFMNIYQRELSRVQPDAIAVAFDLPAPTFRHKAVATYKATRHPMPEELAMQMPLIQTLLPALGAKTVFCEGYEADDILGTLAFICEQAAAECTILTGDRDNLQLLSDGVIVDLATNRETISYTPDFFLAEYGFAPLSLIDYKALMGDHSDNISGVPGIGEKTASKLIAAFGTIENLYEHLDDPAVAKSTRQKLINGRADAERSKWLATIVKDAPIDTDLSHYLHTKGDHARAGEMLLDLEMGRLYEKFFGKKAIPKEKKPVSPKKQIVLTISPLTKEILDSLKCPACLFSEADGAEQLRLLDPENPAEICKTEDMNLILTCLKRQRLTFQAKPQYRFLLSHGVPLEDAQLAQDAELAGYLLNPSSSDYAIKKLCVTYHIPTTDEPDMDLHVLPQLYETMHRLLEREGMLPLLEMERRLTAVLASMEHIGVRIDTDGVREFGTYLSEQLDKAQKRVFEEAGRSFNIASPKQLGDVLFGEMQLPHGKRTKSGYSTSADILEELRGTYPIVEHVLDWRQYAKLKSTYVDGLLKKVGPDGRIHSLFRQTETRTGRISSTEPNLQNIPVRTPLGRNMRKFFVASPGCVLLDADYSQIELRILANLSGDKAMQEAFLSGADIHAATAAQVFGMPPEMVTHEMRSAAKAVNFGILYGMGAYSLSQDIHVSLRQASRYIQNYKARFPNVDIFMEKTIADARRLGYVTTYFKRRRQVPELTATNKTVQAAGRRIAMNTPIQGTAADIIKYAMVFVHQKLREKVPDAKLILQIHDELILEVPVAHAMAAAKVLGEEMQGVISHIKAANPADFPVPLTADVRMGESWFEAKEEE